MRNELKTAFPNTIPVLLGYISVGIAFGIIIVTSGLSIWTGLLMSCFIYAGAMQFVAISLIISPVGILQIILITLFVNIRHIFYGLSFLELFKNFGVKKYYLIFALTDETYSLLCGLSLNDLENKENTVLAISLLNQLYWIIGTLIGSFIGNILKFNTNGIEFAMTALFIVIYIEQWLAYKTHRPALIGVLVSTIALATFGSANMVLPSMVLILLFLFVMRESIEKNDEVGI